jgi:hypothetical protein
MNNDQILTILINYGLAGIVIYIFYVLLKNELHELRESIEKLSDKIERLIILLEIRKRGDNNDKR